jgi:hypothetical protein
VVSGEDEVAGILAGLSDDELREFAASLERLAFHMSDRIHYAESRRSSFLTASTGLLAAGIALAALTKSAPTELWPAFYAAGAGLVAVAAAVLFVYAQQTNPPYGFIQTDEESSELRPWKWFYRDALSNWQSYRAIWHGRPDRQDRDQSREAFLSDWSVFARRYVKLANPSVDADQNLRQVYLLHVNERYKNAYLTQIRNVFVRGLLIAAVFALIVGGGIPVISAAFQTSSRAKSPLTSGSSSPSPIPSLSTAPSPATGGPGSGPGGGAYVTGLELGLVGMAVVLALLATLLWHMPNRTLAAALGTGAALTLYLVFRMTLTVDLRVLWPPGGNGSQSPNVGSPSPTSSAPESASPTPSLLAP